MTYPQKLSSYLATQVHAPRPTLMFVMAAYMHAQQQAMRASMDPEQALIAQFMGLNDGQKMKLVQMWLLQNPQFFKRSA